MTRRQPEDPPTPNGARLSHDPAATDVRIAAIRELLHDICAAADGRDLAPGWGSTSGPETPGARFVIACPPDRPFETIGVMPWPDEEYGGIDVHLRDAPWDWPPYEAAFGPFREEVQIPGAPRRMVATWDEPTLPATADVTAWVGPLGVVSLSVRRDPRLEPISRPS